MTKKPETTKPSVRLWLRECLRRYPDAIKDIDATMDGGTFRCSIEIDENLLPAGFVRELPR